MAQELQLLNIVGRERDGIQLSIMIAVNAIE
jgi:hypothetical protein